MDTVTADQTYPADPVEPVDTAETCGTVEGSPPRSRRRAEGPPSRWKPVPGRAPARVLKPRQWPFVSSFGLGALVAASQVGDDGVAELLGGVGLAVAFGSAALAWTARRRYVAQCALPPGDATVVLSRLSPWRVLPRVEVATELVRSVGATWPQAVSLVRSPQSTLVCDVDRSVAHALASRLRAAGAAVEVTVPVPEQRATGR